MQTSTTPLLLGFFLCVCNHLFAYDHQIINLRSHACVIDVPEERTPALPGVGGALAAVSTWALSGMSMPYASKLARKVMHKKPAQQTPHEQQEQQKAFQDAAKGLGSVLGVVRVLGTWYAGTRLHMLAHTLMNAPVWLASSVQLLQQHVRDIALLRTLDARIGSYSNAASLALYKPQFATMRKTLQRVILAMTNTAQDSWHHLADTVHHLPDSSPMQSEVARRALEEVQHDLAVLVCPVVLEDALYQDLLKQNNLVAHSVRMLEEGMARSFAPGRAVTATEISVLVSHVRLLAELAAYHEGHKPAMNFARSMLTLIKTYGLGMRSSALKEATSRCVRVAAWHRLCKRLGMIRFIS